MEIQVSQGWVQTRATYVCKAVDVTCTKLWNSIIPQTSNKAKEAVKWRKISVTHPHADHGLPPLLLWVVLEA